MDWFLVGIVCIAAQCAPVQAPQAFESPPACLRESQVFVSQTVNKLEEHGLTRVKTWCVLGEERRGELLDLLKRGKVPELRLRDA